MPQGDWLIMVVGGVFIVLGIIGIAWGRHEEKRLFEALAARRDLREFTLGNKGSPQPGAIKMGGRIAIALGVLMVVAGIIFWCIGWPLE